MLLRDLNISLENVAQNQIDLKEEANNALEEEDLALLDLCVFRLQNGEGIAVEVLFEIDLLLTLLFKLF